MGIEKQKKARAKLNTCISALDPYSLHRNEGFIFPLEVANYEWCNDGCSVFKVKSLWLLHFYIAKKLKEYTVDHLLVTDEEVLLALTNKRQ